MEWLANMGAMFIGALAGTSIVRLAWPDAKRSELEELRREVAQLRANTGPSLFNEYVNRLMEDRRIEAIFKRIDVLETTVKTVDRRLFAMEETVPGDIEKARNELLEAVRVAEVGVARTNKTAQNGEDRAVEAHERIDRLEELTTDYGTRTVALQGQCATALAEVRALRHALGEDDWK